MKLKISKPSVMANLYRLTKRERPVLTLICDGSSDKEIAEKLHISINAVKKHNNNILEKLALQTRLEIAKYTPASNNHDTAIGTSSSISE